MCNWTWGKTVAAHECYQKAVDMIGLSNKEHVEAMITEESSLFHLVLWGLFSNWTNMAMVLNSNMQSLQETSTSALLVLQRNGFLRHAFWVVAIISLQGMRLKRVYGLIKGFKSHQKIIKHLRCNGISIPSPYEEAFRKVM